MQLPPSSLALLSKYSVSYCSFSSHPVCLSLSCFSFSLASNIIVVFLVAMCWVRPMVSREKEKIRFSLFFLLSFYLNLCSSSKLASCFGCKHYWRHAMEEEEEEEKEDEHVKTRSMCVYKHISILQHYFFSFYLSIYFFLKHV